MMLFHRRQLLLVLPCLLLMVEPTAGKSRGTSTSSTRFTNHGDDFALFDDGHAKAALRYRHLSKSGNSKASDMEEEEEEETCVNPDGLEIPCGTPSPTECEKVLEWIAMKEPEDPDCRRARRRIKVEDYSYNINVIMHVLKKSGQSSNSFSEKTEFMTKLNEGFADTPFRFTLQQVKFVNDNNRGWHTIKPSNINTMKSSLRTGNKKKLNIFIGDTTLVGYLGVATFPHAMALSGGKERDGVVIMNPDLYTNAELNNADFDLKEEVRWTVVHEVGHWLGLYHVFEGNTCDESSPFAGDQVADTPTSSCPAWNFQDWDVCFEDRKPPQGKGKKDYIDSCKGASGKDDLHNFMNYNAGHCMEEQGHFTEGQVIRMITQYEIFRKQNHGFVYDDRRALRRRCRSLAVNQYSDRIISSCIHSIVHECDCAVTCSAQALAMLETDEFAYLHQSVYNQSEESCSSCTVPLSRAECQPGKYCNKLDKDDWYQHWLYPTMMAELQGPHGRIGNQCYPSHDSRSYCTSGEMCLSGYCEEERCVRGQGDPCEYKDDCSGGNCKQGFCMYTKAAKIGECWYRNQLMTALCPSNFCNLASGMCQECKSDDDCEDNGLRFCHNETGVCQLKRAVGHGCNHPNACADGAICHEQTAPYSRDLKNNGKGKGKGKGKGNGSGSDSDSDTGTGSGSSNGVEPAGETEEYNHVEDYGKCVVCTSNDDCSGATEFCDLYGTGRCIECLDNDGCDPDWEYCNTINPNSATYRKCVPKRISTNFHSMCGNDFQCLSGYCIETRCIDPQCFDNDGCTDEEKEQYCDTLDTKSLTHLKCVSKHYLKVPCARDHQCVSGICSQGICVTDSPTFGPTETAMPTLLPTSLPTLQPSEAPTASIA